MARKRKKKAKGGRRRASRQAESLDTTKDQAKVAADATPAPAAVVDDASSTAVTAATRKDDPISEPKPYVDPDASGAPQERMAATPLAVTLPDVAQADPEASGEFWSPNRRQAEPEAPMVEFHPENPDASPVVSGVIQGFVAHENPEARASSALAVEFGTPGEPSIQIEATYEQDSKKLLDSDSPGEGGTPIPEDPVAETPVEAVAASESVTPELGAGPFDGDTDRVSVHPSFEEPHAKADLPEAEVLPAAEVLPTAEVDDISEGESLPVYAMDQADGPLVEVPEPDEEGPAPTKRASVMDSLQPETRTDDQGPAVVHPSPFPPAQDPRVKDAETPISDTGAYTAPDHEPKAPVSLRPFQPAAFVRTAEFDGAPAAPEAEVIKPKLAGVPPLILPPKEPAEPPAPEPPEEPVGNPPATASGVIGGAIVVPSGLQQQQDAGEPLTASGSIIIDPELLAAEKAAAEQAAIEKAAAEKAAADHAAAEKAAIEKAAADHAAEQAAAEQAAAEQAAAEQAAAEQAAAEQAAAEQAAAEKAAAEKAAAEQAAAEKAVAEKAIAQRAAAEKAAAQVAEAERAAAEKAEAEKAAEKAARRAAAETAETETTPKPDARAPKPTALGNAMAATVRFELSEQPETVGAKKKPEPPTTRPVTSSARRIPKPLKKADAFSDMEIEFFEQDLQKVDEVDTFDDLVADLPEPDTPWGRLFGKPKGKPKGKSIKRPEPNRRAVAEDKPKKTPRPPHKRK